jgi:O-antigen ligase
VDLTRRRRTYLVATATAAIVVAANASEGAYFSQSWGWVALAFLVPTTVILILDRATVPGRLRLAFAAFMAALAGWTLLSALWSISPSASIRDFERTFVYAALAFAVALVLRRADASALYAGALVGSGVVISYGLATWMFPDSLGPYDDPSGPGRLFQPVGYSNAVGLLAAIGAILALGASWQAPAGRHRAAAAALVPVFVTATYLTFSRGATAALILALLVAIMAASDRRRLITIVVACAPGALLAIASASRYAPDSVGNPPEADGVSSAVFLLSAALLSAALVTILSSLVGRQPAAAVRGEFLLVAVVIAGVASVVAAVLLRSDLGSLASPATGSSTLSDRVLSISGNGRLEQYRVALSAAEDALAIGQGAGTYEYLWYRHRPNTDVLRDAHSLALEVLAELGLVGLALLTLVLVLPVIAGVASRRNDLVVPAVAAYIGWIAAASIDWHWEMVGVTLTSLLTGAVALLASERGTSRRLGGAACGTLVAAGCVASVFAVWSLVGNQALFAARDAVEREDWNDALDHGRRARALLVWSHEPELVLAAAAAGAGDRDAAVAAARDAVGEDPRDWIAWLQLARVASGSERAGAYDRVRELNPREEGLPGE